MRSGPGEIKIEAGGHPDRIFVETELIVLSPGVPKIPQVLAAHRHGVPVISELELGWLLSDAPFVRHHRNERQVHGHDARGAHAREGGQEDPGRREHRERTDRNTRTAPRAGLDRGGTFELSARGHRHLPAPGGDDPEHHPGPPGPVQGYHRVRRGQGADLREPAQGRCPGPELR